MASWPTKWQLMRYVNGLIGATFLLLAVVHVGSTPLAHWACNAMLFMGGVLAISALWQPRKRYVASLLAVATTILMFAFFASFFMMVPQFGEGWYTSPLGLEAISVLIGAFALIPVLSAHSCRLKGDCADSIQEKRVGFFAPPSDLRKQTTF